MPPYCYTTVVFCVFYSFLKPYRCCSRHRRDQHTRGRTTFRICVDKNRCVFVSFFTRIPTFYTWCTYMSPNCSATFDGKKNREYIMPLGQFSLEYGFATGYRKNNVFLCLGPTAPRWNIQLLLYPKYNTTNVYFRTTQKQSVIAKKGTCRTESDTYCITNRNKHRVRVLFFILHHTHATCCRALVAPLRR